MAVAALRVALESERSRLQEIDASIKRIVQTPPAARHNQDRFNSSNDGSRGALGRMSGGGLGAPRGDYPEEAGKRRHETKTVFSRLSGRQDGDSDNEDGGLVKKPRLSSQVTRDLPSKQEIMKAQCGDEQSKVRNRRMFGSLLGTLHKFKQEELVLQGREDKRAQVERRIEQQAAREKEKHKRERQTLFAERELKKATIKALEAKMARVAEFDVWAASERTLVHFIQTTSQPRVHWTPRLMDARAQRRLDHSAAHRLEFIEKKRKELEEELVQIEQRCLRMSKNSHATQSAKENKREERRQSGESDTVGADMVSCDPVDESMETMQDGPRLAASDHDAAETNGDETNASAAEEPMAAPGRSPDLSCQVDCAGILTGPTEETKMDDAVRESAEKGAVCDDRPTSTAGDISTE